MEQYYRLVIEALKMTLSDYVSSGYIDRDMLRETYAKLGLELDRRIVNRQPYEEIEALMKDISWTEHDLLFYHE